jgi:hypothetical protein
MKYDLYRDATCSELQDMVAEGTEAKQVEEEYPL